MNELIITFLLGAGFLAIFGTGEFFYHAFHFPPEITRKFVHLSSGLLTLTFPRWLTNHWLVLALCASFAMILVTSQRFGFLKSINSVNRVTRGSYLFPAAVYISYLVFLSQGDLLYFFLPVLILAISDPLAALFGKKWPFGRYKVGAEHKTMTGSGIFMISALVTSVLLFNYLGEQTPLQIVLTSFGISLIACISEALSRKGWDNILIPLSVIGSYWLMNYFF